MNSHQTAKAAVARVAVIAIEINSERAASLIQSGTACNFRLAQLPGFQLCRYFFRKAMAYRAARCRKYRKSRKKAVIEPMTRSSPASSLRRRERLARMKNGGETERATKTLGQSRHVAYASSSMSIRTSLEEGIKLHRFAGIFPEQFLTEAGGHREAVVAADQRMVIRCFGDDLAGFVHDASHVPPPIQRAGPCWRPRQGQRRDRTMPSSVQRHPLSVPAFMMSPE